MSDYFYRHPRLLILAISLIVVAGISSFLVLPRMEDPLLTQRVSIITTIYPGADAERVEALVTEPIEHVLREIEEIKEVRSSSRSAASMVTVTLNDNVYDVDEVWSRVRDKLNDARADFPATVLEPDFRTTEIKAYATIVALVWDHDSTPNYAILRRHAEALEDRLLALGGTEKSKMFGDPEEEYVATVDANQLSLLGLTAADVARSLSQSDAKVSAGLLRGERNDFLIEVAGKLNSIDRIGRTPLRVTENGDVVRVQDVAYIQKGIRQPATSLTLVDSKPSVALGLYVRDDSRIDLWARDVAQVLADYQEQLPPGIRLETLFEQNGYVAARLSGLINNLLLGALAVMVVILLTMGWRSALVVAVALPLSSLMVLAGLRFLGIPVHQMSVTGLIIALGLLIDNAIVMVDEVATALRRGASRRDAVRETVRHLAMPLIGSTVTTALAFAPIALMPGPAGEFVGSIAISVILAIFSSLFVAMTIVPALAAMGIRPRTTARWWEEGISLPRLARGYAASLQFVLRRPWLGITGGLLLPALGFLAATQLTEQFFPPADRDQFHIELELPSQTSLAETTGVARAIRAYALQQPNICRIDWFLGESIPAFYYNIIPRRENASNYGQAMVQVERLAEVRSTIRQLQLDLDQRFPQARLLVRQLEQGPPFDAPVEVRLLGPDIQVLRELGNEVRTRLTAIPNVIHTRSDLDESIAKLTVHVDEEAARLAGLDHLSIAQQLQTQLEGITGGSVLEETEELPVRVQLQGSARASREDIASLELQTSTGNRSDVGSVPLSAVARLQLVAQSATISRRDGRRINEVQAYTTAGILPATVLNELQQRLQEEPLSLPPGYSLAFGGEAAERDNAVGNLLASVGILVVLMIATLVLSFGSFRLSAIVATVAAMSMGLGLGALWVFGYPFGFMAIVGSMGLMGVAINDAIVVLAGIRSNGAAKSGDTDAISEVVQATSRHVVATSLTTMAGFAPLILGGGEFWPPLAVSIAGGVAGATILALYFVPSLYLSLLCRARCQEVRLLPIRVAKEVVPAAG